MKIHHRGENTHHIDFIQGIGLQCVLPGRYLLDIFELYEYHRNNHYQPLLTELVTGWSRTRCEFGSIANPEAKASYWPNEKMLKLFPCRGPQILHDTSSQKSRRIHQNLTTSLILPSKSLLSDQITRTISSVMPRSRSPRTNDEIRHSLRYDAEWYHRQRQEYFFHTRPLILPLNPSSLDLEVQLEQIQDSCNKSTAIYCIHPPLEPHTKNYCQEFGRRADIIYYLYERWFCDHHVDIDFGKFVAKLISVSTAVDQQASIEEIITFHQVWCKHVEHALTLCGPNKDLQGVPVRDRPYDPSHGCMGINQDQNMHFKLRSVFRSLIIIVDNNATQGGAERVVHLVRTDLSELSAPITFESVSPKLEHDPSRGRVTTTLSAAITFVMALELREQAAFPEEYGDPSVLEEREGPGKHMEIAKSKGYSGPHLSGPSSGWVQLAEGEEVMSPVTPFLMSRWCRLGVDRPRQTHDRGRRKARQMGKANT